MKTPDKNKQTKLENSGTSKLKTEKPLAEKDEVKKAEDRQRKKAKGES